MYIFKCVYTIIYIAHKTQTLYINIRPKRFTNVNIMYKPQKTQKTQKTLQL